ncbi:MAG TPA: aromatic ring-hydroxylating dioxygenase subunit alpha [Acetobacteraceae bacterium]|nr:aromatic ring-hydroxylating dioxygenase subunit alpha [Acetobacteraceae bacterium]
MADGALPALAEQPVSLPPALRTWPDGGTARVPNWVYTDPGIFALEQDRVFGENNWLYVCLDAELRNPGDFKRTRLGTRDVVAVRGTDGAINVLVNRCAHRSMQFCTAARGTAKEFVCPYHQWTYDLSGNLLGVPFRRGYRGQGGMPADFRPEEHGLQRLTVAQRHGVVFASFGSPNESLETWLGERMLGYFDRVFDGRTLEVLGYVRQRIPSNWKLMFENIKDPYHASLLHVFLVTFGLFRLDQQSAVEMDETGRHAVLVSRRGAQETNDATSQMRAFKANFTLRDKRLLDPVREFPGDATVVMQTLWPNLIVQQQSNTLAMRQIVPLDSRTFDLAWTFFGYADDTPEMRQRRLRQANLMGPAGLVSLDDSEAMLLSQAGIETDDDAACMVEMGGREVTNEPHMVTETAIRGFYQHYRSVMGL